MKPGDMVKVISCDNEIMIGKLGIVLSVSDVSLRSGRLCYVKVLMVDSGKALYWSSSQLEVVCETG